MTGRGPAVAALAVAVAALTGCTSAPALQELGLPGSSVDGYEVRVRFTDALDLVPLATVKLDGVDVGVVREVDLTDGLVAEVTVQVEQDVALPGDVSARISQTSLLGEKYVELISPSGSTAAPLAAGGLIPLERTGAGVEVEELLGAASALLNGGGIGHLQTVTSELNTALAGREDQVRVLLDDLAGLLAAIDARRDDIVRALDGVDRLAGTLAAQRDTIEVALEALPGGVAALADQQRQLTRALTSLSEFGTVAERVIAASKDDLVTNLELLDPILTEIARAAPSFFSTVDTLLTYPFARNIYGGIAGDYVQLEGELEVDLDSFTRDTFVPGPSYEDPPTQIACGEYGPNCRPGPTTPAAASAAAPAPTAPALGPALLDALAGAGR